MARCRCADESVCTCVIRAGQGVTVQGTGAPSSPWVITATANSSGTIEVADTPSVDMATTGVGVLGDPLIISARAIIGALLNFIDNPFGVDFSVAGAGTEASPMGVEATIPRIDLGTTPTVGFVLAFDGTRYVPVPPTTVPIGSINIGPGLIGDGSSGSPLRVDVCTYAELKAACATP